MRLHLVKALSLCSCLALISAGCGEEPHDGTSRLELPEPDRQERLNYEALERLRNSGCEFPDPDTSLSDMRLRDAKSTTDVIKTGNEPDSTNQYHFYNADGTQVATLTREPGNDANSISGFKVTYTGKGDGGYKRLPADIFQTEKGICLGMSKRRIIARLGSCYAALDSGQNYLELRYRIVPPGDSRTRLLARHGQPFYQASYRLRNDRLEAFAFGFDAG